MPEMAGRPGEREILERTVRAIADRARDAYRLVDEAHDADPRDESGLTAQAKRLRMELLQTKAELERELGRRLLRCRRCNRRVIGSRSRSGARTLELRGAVGPGPRSGALTALIARACSLSHQGTSYLAIESPRRAPRDSPQCRKDAERSSPERACDRDDRRQSDSRRCHPRHWPR